MLKYTCISRTATYEIYRITAGFHGLTYDEIANKIDCNHWGYDVRIVTPDFIEIKIYID